MPRLHPAYDCDDRTMPCFAFCIFVRSTQGDPTTSCDLINLYNLVIVCTFINFQKRKTVAGRHVVGSIVRRPCDDRAVTARFFMMICGLKIEQRP